MRRIALYGGTFDPVHNGHLAVAENLVQQFALDEVLFIPAHVAPHKRERRVTPALQRYAMLVLATQQESLMRVSSIELDAPEKPYTVETLTRLQDEMGHDSRLFFVMGADSWTEITTWREWERLLLAMTDHIVVTRPGYELSTSHVTEQVGERVVDLRGVEKQSVAREIDANEGTKIFVTDAVNMDVSSTEIRRAISQGRNDEALEMVPVPVAEFIRKYRLYRDQA
jgi:nicotinate-nucleotide adenylyltransferase